MRFSFTVVAGGCLLIAILAVVSAAESTTGDAWIAPPAVNAERNPLANLPETWPGGAKVFRQRCATCHAADGTGTGRGPNLMTGPVQKQSDGALFWKISSGNTRSGMPSFSFLRKEQRWQLVAHLRAATQH